MVVLVNWSLALILGPIFKLAGLKTGPYLDPLLSGQEYFLELSICDILCVLGCAVWTIISAETEKLSIKRTKPKGSEMLRRAPKNQTKLFHE